MMTMEFDWSVYSDGRVCISILHTPGEDPLGYESPAERWSPVQSIEKILLSVVSMLAGVCRSYNSSTSLAVYMISPLCECGRIEPSIAFCQASQ